MTSLPDTKHAVITYLRQTFPTTSIYGGVPDDLTQVVPAVIVYRPPGPAPMEKHRWDTAAINIQVYAGNEAAAFALCSSVESALIDAEGKVIATPPTVFNKISVMTGVGENHDPNLPDFYRYTCTMIVRARKG